MHVFIKKENKRLKRIRLPYSDLSQSSRVRDMNGEVSVVAGDSSVPVIGLTERTDAIVRGLVFLLEHHAAPTRVIASLREQLHSYLDTSSSEGVWLKRAKYALTYPCAKFLRNELPPCPDLVWKPSGPLRRWMKARMNAFNRKNVHLWYSWLQAKRCALSVSDTMITDAYDKHFKQLTQADPCLPSFGSEGARWLSCIFENPVFNKVLNHVADRVGQIYNSDFDLNQPSNNACFEASRSSGGQFHGLTRIAEALNITKSADYARESGLSGLAHESMHCPEQAIFGARSGTPKGSKKGVIAPERTCFIGGFELMRMDVRRFALGDNICFRVVEQTELCGRFWWKMLSIFREIRARTVPANLQATIQVVLEPLKMRIISKGNAYEYYQMKPLQKALHQALREMPCFRLLGRPLCPTDLIDLVPHSLTKEMKWHSVDYSAATDGLSSHFGMEILDRVLRDVPSSDRISAGKVLGPHELYYPQFKDGKWTADSVHKGLQTNGQLMGGILSFPILCLANLGVYLAVKAKQDSEITCETLQRVLINGDDMLYIGTPTEWEDHKVIGKSVGLEMSPGKAYVHSSYANANSTCFVYDFAHAGATPYQINYLNVGLVFGQHKVQSRVAGTAESHHDSPEGCAANIPAILAGTLPGKQAEVLRYVLETRKVQLRKDCAMLLKQGRKTHIVSRNLFLPINLGGMGIDAPIGHLFKIKPIDRRIAAAKLERSKYWSASPLSMFAFVEDPIKPTPWIAKQATPEIPELALGHTRKVKHIQLVPHVPVWPSPGVHQE
jgi:hypothetical protein